MFTLTLLENEWVGAGLGLVTFTICVASSEAPKESVTSSRTANVPAEAYLCRTTVPDRAIAPSPKSQKFASPPTESPGSGSVDPDASTVSVGPLSDVVNVATGARSEPFVTQPRPSSAASALLHSVWSRYW